MDNFSLTDGAAELVELGELLRKIPRSSQPTYEAISAELGLAPDSSETVALFGAVGMRINKFSSFARTVADPFLDNRTRAHVLRAINQFAGLFHPSGMMRQWGDASQAYITEEMLATINLFSKIAREYRPLRKLSEDDRQTIIVEIERQISDINSDEQTLPEWLKLPLTEGLENIRFQLKMLPYFGLDIIIDQLLIVHQRSIALEK
jgi:hypothetical protein